MRTLALDDLEAVIFDLDGVLTDTASVHAAAWKRLFDEYLEARSRLAGDPFLPFTEEDYLRHVDGKPRYDGVRSFLESRGISLPEGDPSDPQDLETVSGLGNRKNAYFLAALEREGPSPYPSTVRLVEELRSRGIKTAIISSSRNTQRVLAAAGLEGLFDTLVDGLEADRLGLPGKPDPAVFLEAARRLDADPARTAVVEDALSGVEAGRAGGFGLVVGVDRAGQAEALRAHGADLVVSDLSEVGLAPGRIPELPSALDETTARLAARSPAVFLDYDGTLTEIVDDPAAAVLSDRAREAVDQLSRRCPVAIISGRDLADVRSMVDLDHLVYAGSHGFDIAGAGTREQRGTDFLPALDQAESALGERLAGIPGVSVERKRFAIAVHFRKAERDRVEDVERIVRQVAEEHPELRVTGGKEILELRPGIEWDKGRALLWLLEVMDLDRPEVLPIYLGDDVTDEDAFRALRARGLGIVVGTDDRETAASLRLADPVEAAQWLEELARELEGGSS